jgi:MFS family permease
LEGDWTNEEARKKSLSYSVKDGIAWSVNSGLGSSYITPYALALNANNTQIGLLTSVPNLVANLSQLETPKLMEKTSRKRIVTNSVLIQAFTWLPISLVAFLFLFSKVGSLIAPMLVILFYTIYLLLGSFLSPAWSSWMGDLVREKERGRFFGRRNTIVGIAGISAMLVGGIFLNIFKRSDVLFGFVTLFLAAMVARLMSWHFLTKQHEPKFKYKHEYYFSFSNFLKRMKDNNFGRFTIYATLMDLMVNLASPFFAVYMLRELNFSYFVFVIVTLSASVSSVLVMPLWGKFSDKYGNLRSLRICGLLIPVVPVLWLVSPNPVYLIIAQGISGILWAGYNLASTNFIYDAVTEQRRGICFAYFGALDGICIFVGATLGGLFATYINVGFMSTLLLLFLVSGVLRLAVSVVLLPKLREVRKVKPTKPIWYFIWDFIRRRLPSHLH